jgi:3-hydroxyacyl-CoA dehydrogenase
LSGFVQSRCGVFPASVDDPDKEDSLSNFIVRKAAVLGAGVMGAQIAAHLANAEVPVVLFDLPAKEGDPNGIVRKAIDALKKLEPSPLATKDRVAYIDAANYSQHLDQLKDCDLIIEAIAEKTEWKDDLYRKIAPFISPDAIIASNTSGLSINRLSEGLPEALRSRFCGIHFFNPPRYMHLVELIATRTTDPALLDNLESWLVSRLGKGVVRALDTPNFVANRVGVFSILAVMHHTQRLGLGFDVVDSLTGPIIGRPKSATYRTADVVGLDTLAHVIKTMQDTLPDDPWHGYYGVPAWLAALIGKGALGQKTRGGIFRKDGRAIKVLDLALQDYRDSAGDIDPTVLAILKNRNPAEKFAQLRASEHPQAQFLWAIFRDIFPLRRFPPRRHRRQRARPRLRDALGFRLGAGSVRKLAGRRLAGDCRSGQGRHRRRPGNEPGTAAGVGLRPGRPARCAYRTGLVFGERRRLPAALDAARLSAADLPRAGAGREGGCR